MDLVKGKVSLGKWKINKYLFVDELRDFNQKLSQGTGEEPINP